MDQNQKSETSTSEDQLSRALALQKSYVGPSVVVFLLYWLFYFPGLIFNILWLKEADRTKKVTGQSPPGMGCLGIMFLLGMLPLLFFVSCLSATGSALQDAGRELEKTQQRFEKIERDFDQDMERVRRQSDLLTEQLTRSLATPVAATPTPRPATTPRRTPSATASTPPRVVQTVRDFAPGTVFQLLEANVLDTGSDYLAVPPGAWIRIDRVERLAATVRVEVEVRHSDGRVIGTGRMSFASQR